MPRAKRGFKARRRRNRILNHAEGFWGGRSRLFAVANEVVQVVNVMSPHNRVRFAHDAELLASWDSASTVFATPRPDLKPSTGGTPPTGGDVRPAA